MEFIQPNSSMKRTLCSVVLGLLATLGGNTATLPLYLNNTPLTAPTLGVPVPVIDARAWVNTALFNIATTLPYESQNTLFFTNTSGMYFDPGVRYQRNANGKRFWMDTWVNQETNYTDHTSLFSGLLVSDSRASILQVAATNIISTGPLFSGTHGLIRLEGKNIDVSRIALRTGSSVLPLQFFGGGFLLFSSNYVNDVGVTDLYWGAGNGDALVNNRSRRMPVNGSGFSPNFNLPFPSSTPHETVVPSSFTGFFFTNTTIVPGSFSSGTNFFFNTNFASYDAVAYTNTLSSTSRVVQVVFYPTNTGDPNLTTDVRFFPQFEEPALAVVAFHSLEFDLAIQSEVTNSVFLSDGLAATTNYFLARNASVGTRRPNTFEVTRSIPYEYYMGSGGNAVYSTDLLFNQNFSDTSVTNRYAAYAARVDLLSSSPSGAVPYNVTNAPGRVEIIGNEVNLDQTRIRAESAVIIKTSNLVSNYLAQVDAPLVNFDARSTQPTFVISNLAPLTVRRLSGAVRGWSAKWQNFEPVTSGTNVTTNTVLFHVLIVESQLRSQVPVTVNEFAARATNVVVNDTLNIGKSFAVEANSFHLAGGLTLPYGSSIGASNLINVRNFTNDGVISITGSEFFGTDRALSYSNYVNHGTNTAATHEIRTRNFENTGLIIANGGTFSLDAVNTSLIGNPLITSNSLSTNFTFTILGTLQTNVFTNTTVIQAAPSIQGIANVIINARELAVSNSIISAGTLIVNVTNSLKDFGVEATNLWSVSKGFQFTRLPVTSDLFGTYLRSTAPRFALVDHVWAGEDRGIVPAGFTNNLALGKLILDGGDRSLFRFTGAGTSNALYVDFLELDNYATNISTADSRFLSIAPNMTIYFANANVPVSRIDGAANGRLRWVSSFTGPLSSTNITYPSGSNYIFNVALTRSKDLDSDGDGIVNWDDPTPVYVAESAVLSVTLASDPELRVNLTWNALAYSSNYLEFKTTAAAATNWQILTNFHMGPYTWPVSISDPVNRDGENRVYRLRVDPGLF